MTSLPHDNPVVRRLEWREPVQQRRPVSDWLLARAFGKSRTQAIGRLAVIGCLAAAAPLTSRVTGETAVGSGPGDLVRLLRTMETISVEATVMTRFYPTSLVTTVPTDGSPSFGSATFLDSGLAWRIQNDFDPARFTCMPVTDSSFDGDATVVTYLPLTNEATITTTGEQDVPYTNVWHPWFRLGMWLQSHPLDFRFATTRADLLIVSESSLDMANEGWEAIDFEGAAAEATMVDYGPGCPAYRIIALEDSHDQPLAIELYDASGNLSQRVYFSEWEVPTWSTNSSLAPQALPHVVTLLCFTPSGELCSDITTTITACAIDMPISAEAITTPLSQAESLFDEDTRERIW
ncbi:MAG: hypothetical protein JNL80_11770 [Phycisphaerae bacterium]|nr:hypothetical protein [Phycisphaerae bacterium]